MTLPRRKLGNTGLEVSLLGLGTVKIGRNQGVKYPQAFALPTDNEVSLLLDSAQELGINLLDTAPAYGSSEQRLGKLLRARADWLLCTKAGEEFTEGKSRFDFSAAAIRRSVERSLRNLQTEYLDLVLVHSDGSDLEIIQQSDCFATLQRMQEAGAIRAIGMSSKTTAGGLAALPVCDVVMVTCNPRARDDLPVIAAAAAQNKGVLIKKALASGHLQEQTSGDPVRNNLEFVLGQPGVHSVIVGTLNPEHLRHNAAAAVAAAQD